MTRLFKIVVIGLCCLMAVALNSVGANNYSPLQTAETAKPPQSGGVLSVALRGKPTHLNSAIQSGIYTCFPGAQIFAFLLRVNNNWEYQPYLAEKWEVSADGLSVTFHLRSGVTFHDGKPLTSEDVAFSIMTIQKYHPFSGMLAPVGKVDTPDPLTAVIRLKQPHPALLTALASPLTPILPKHVYGDGQDMKTHPANLKPVGSGPFRFVSFNDSEIVLEKYSGFFLPGRPYLDKLLIKIMEIPVIPIAFETGIVHLDGFTEAADLRNQMLILETNRVEYGGYEGIGGLIWLAFNLRKPPLNDIRVRRAFAYTIDRDFLAKAVYGDKGKVATGPISSKSPFYSDNVNKYPVNTALANKLLDEAGYPRNDKGIRFTLTLCQETSLHSGAREYVQSVLSRKLGVEIKTVDFDKFGDWAKFVSNGEFELTLDTVYNWGDPVIGVHRTYSSRNIRPGVIWSNTQGYSNPVVDELMDKAGTEMDIARRKSLYAEFQKQVVEDLPVYWLYQLPHGTIHHRNLMGVKNASVWGLVFPFTDVYWSK